MSEWVPSERGLLEINHFIVPRGVLGLTIDFLKEVGRSGAEGFVLWGGKPEGKTKFRFTRAITPEQRAISTDEGLLVVVDGEALFRVNKSLYECGEILGGQIHSHPTSAYHSDTDDHFPLVTVLGALSLVLPDFARNAPMDIGTWACYRLREYGRWTPLSKEDRIIFE
jgi:hypothetical protein